MKRYCGRDFTDPELERIRALIAEDPNRTRAALSRLTCQALAWFNLKSSVEQGAECVIFFAWQGAMTSNSGPIARSCNVARRKIGRALHPVAASPYR